MDILGNFLRKSVDCNRRTQADKVQEDIVELWDDLDPHETGQAFRIPKDQYLKMIKLWKELCIAKSKEIFITWDGKEIVVVGNNEVVSEAVFQKFENEIYSCSRVTDLPLADLGYFLVCKFHDKKLSHNFILNDWVNDSSSQSLKCYFKDQYDRLDFIFIGKKNGLISIIINDGTDKSLAFVITKEKLRDLYQQFKKIEVLKPQYISFVRDNDEIKIEGKNQDIPKNLL